MSDLGLNAHHEEEVKKYLKFARYNRNQQLRTVDGCFDDLKASRLNEETFTLDEVEEIVDNLKTVVRSSVESELNNDAHTNVLMLVQLFNQAEKWHLKLLTDVSELENQKLLKEVAEFEENVNKPNQSKGLASTLISQKPKLEPLNEGGSTPLLQMEINRLTEENEQLKNKLANTEQSALQSSKESSKLRSDLEQARAKPQANTQPEQSGKNAEEQVTMLSEKIASLSGSLRDAEGAYQNKCSSLEEEVANAKHYILALQHEIEVLTAESEKRFADTTQFKNLKKMLEQKNSQLKDFRKRLKNYEPDTTL